ncbi:hypothetical protein [Candidatus Odyssella acanthamoebae]|uniref:Uncharacterized protein n=1 Tax=Candidatus Odyssella acanthamoebae TaxID=91604 RepID=A0A077B1X8_9PROT|nr:hypothetical protein [Candidatus Paracaedibacter acanthamoebae]AIK96925.1 hypothetical protein ID47_09595 [Candidatus Paracaedibacter acanthamoebae]
MQNLKQFFLILETIKKYKGNFFSSRRLYFLSTCKHHLTLFKLFSLFFSLTYFNPDNFMGAYAMEAPEDYQLERSSSSEALLLKIESDKEESKTLKNTEEESISSTRNSSLKEVSDDEEIPREETAYFDFHHIITVGTRIKFLANAYLRNIDQTASIFLPYYKLKTKQVDGLIIEEKSYFVTPKKEVCVFVSGGIHNVWEKTVKHVNKLFFSNLNIKIIRASWIQKHLYKGKKERNLEKEFRGRENELHAEFYYDLFFRHQFLPTLLPKLNNISSGSLTVEAFSWWDVCNECEKILTIHRTLLPNNISLSYKIAARRRYNSSYPAGTVIEATRIKKNYENMVYKDIQKKVLEFAAKEFTDEKEKERFWAKSKSGLELSKWLGQAFIENRYTLEGRKMRSSKKGDILAFEMSESDRENFKTLISYLRDTNWELSCWYQITFPSQVQPKWKRHWKQLVIPHFGWELVTEVESEDPVVCQMCGYPEAYNISLIFHPKFNVSQKFLSLSPRDQKLRESDWKEKENIKEDKKIEWDALPLSLKQKRKQSLAVGSQCVQVLLYNKKDIEGWKQRRSADEQEAKLLERDEKLAADELMSKADKNIAKKERLKKRKRRSSKVED